jgi:phosphohistidine phosphatase SixA
MVHAESEPLMVVGHLPLLSRLASWLLTRNADKTLVCFHNGGVV